MKKMFCFVWYIITVRQRKIFFWKQMLVSFGVDFPLYAKYTWRDGKLPPGTCLGLAALEASAGTPT